MKITKIEVTNIFITFRKFLPFPFNVAFPSVLVPPPQVTSWVTTYLIPLSIDLHFQKFYIHGIIHDVVFFCLVPFTGIIILKFIHVVACTVVHSIKLYSPSSSNIIPCHVECKNLTRMYFNFPFRAFTKLHMTLKLYQFKQLYLKKFK